MPQQSKNISKSRYYTLLLGLMWLIIGVGAGYYIHSFEIIIFLIPFILIRKKYAFLILMFGLGVFTAQPSYQQFQELKANKVKSTIVAEAISDASLQKDKSYCFDAKIKSINGRTYSKVLGKICGYGQNVNVLRGDELKINAKYFVSTNSKIIRAYYAETNITTREISSLNNFRRQFISNINTHLNHDQSALATGLVIGTGGQLSKEQNDKMSLSGISHIVAVSGFNITIMLGFLSVVGTKNKKYKLLVTFLSIFIITNLAGIAASISRASMIAGISAVGGYYGYKIRPLAILLLYTSISSLTNPYNLWFDKGWALSLLAFSGIMVVHPILKNNVIKYIDVSKISNIVLEILAVTLIALPYQIFIFGKFNPYSILANIAVYILTLAGMALTILVGLSGFVSYHIASVLSIPLSKVIEVIIKISELFSRVPAISENLQLNIMTILVYYSFLGYFLYKLYRNTPKQKRINLV